MESWWYHDIVMWGLVRLGGDVWSDGKIFMSMF